MQKVNRKSIYCLSAAAAALLIGGAFTAASAYKTVSLDVDGEQRVVSGFQFGTVGELLQKEGVQVKTEDLVQPTGSTKLAKDTHIVVMHAKQVQVQDGDKQAVSISTQAKTVADVLKELGVSLNESDKVSEELTASLKNDQLIKITRRTEEVQVAYEAIPFQTERQPDAEAFTGTEKVLTPGVEGKATITTTIVKEDGKEVDRKVDRQVAQAAVNQLVGYGTKQRPVLVASRSGETFTASKTLTMAASAYSMPGARTATGSVAGKGTVAVDPSVIPLGSKLYIEGYGYAVASDVGGAIQGNRIDVHFDSREEALQFGRRTVQVHILN